MVIKIGLSSLPPFLSAGMRFLIAFLALLIYAVLNKIRFPRDLKTHWFFVWFGMVNFAGGYAFVYWAEQYIASGLASVLFSVMPFYVLILSNWLLPNEIIDIKKIVGVSVGFTGVVIIFWDQITATAITLNSIIGMSAVVAAPVFSSLGTIAGKRVGHKMHPTVLLTIPMLYASVVFFMLSLIFERKIDLIFNFNAIFSIFYLALVGTALAFVLYFWMLRNTSAVLMSMITFITPPLALVWGWLIMDESVTYLLVLGMVLIFAGIIVVRRSSFK
jgi:drug/metabolite transporter (DMT)-like permease